MFVNAQRLVHYYFVKVAMRMKSYVVIAVMKSYYEVIMLVTTIFICANRVMKDTIQDVMNAIVFCY